ncbi:MAG: cryptochrome/photolyase family protein, partial [Gammaproteobacteria bacterium]|nr:cryptochrome/photolyase family protein [Gammaproteobacteria bacterium]
MSRQNSTSRTPANRRNRAFLVLGDQLFNPRLLRHYKDTVVLMAEDFRQFSYVKHHKKKLVLMIAAMRSYADELRRSGFEVHYIKLSHANKDKSLLDKLHALLKQNKFKELIHFEIENKHWESQIEKFAAQHGVREKVLQTPMFLSSRSRFAAFLANTTKPKMADFYRQLRTETNILMTKDRGPVGGKWSFDGDNRKKLPANLPVPNMPTLRHSKHVRDAENLVEQLFPQHPGSVEDFQFPVDRKTALKWLDNFLEYRLTNFGHYQDAISDRSPTLFHSVLSPA